MLLVVLVVRFLVADVLLVIPLCCSWMVSVVLPVVPGVLLMVATVPLVVLGVPFRVSVVLL